MDTAHVSADLATFATLAIIAAVITFLVLLYRRGGGPKAFLFRLLAMLLAAASVAFILMRITTPASEQSRQSSPVNAREPSTDELWNRLTEARINLDDEVASDPPAETTGEAASAARPAWVDAGSKRVGGDVTEVVRSEPFTTVDECYAQLEHQFLVEAWRRMKNVVPESQKELLAKSPVTELGIPLDYVMREICQQEYTEAVDSSVGEMKRVYVLMKFTPQSDAHLLKIWQTQVREASLGLVGKIAALVVASLGGLYGVLRLDTMTRGYYTKRLIAGASAAIIAIAAVLFVR